MKIGIAGIGGIGSNVAVNLVRAGVKKLKCADFDILDVSNLNRQFYFNDQLGRPKSDLIKHNLKRINPGLEIETYTLKLTHQNIKTFFDDCDIVVEGFDNKYAKKMLLEELSGTDKFIVSASGVAGTEIGTIGRRQIGNVIILGDFESDVARLNVFSPKVQIVAAMMAHEVLIYGGWYE